MSSPERVEGDASPIADAHSPENPVSPLSPLSPDSVSRKRKFEEGDSGAEEREPQREDEPVQDEEAEAEAEEDEDEDDNDAGYINPIVDGRNVSVLLCQRIFLILPRRSPSSRESLIPTSSVASVLAISV